MKALNGHYYDPTKSGCGFFFVMKKPENILTGGFFGHTNDGQRLWLTFVASAPMKRNANQVECDVYLTTSGRFPVGASADTVRVGSLTLTETKTGLQAELSVLTTRLARLHPSPAPLPSHETVTTFDLQLLVG